MPWLLASWTRWQVFLAELPFLPFWEIWHTSREKTSLKLFRFRPDSLSFPTLMPLRNSNMSRRFDFLLKHFMGHAIANCFLNIFKAIFGLVLRHAFDAGHRERSVVDWLRCDDHLRRLSSLEKMDRRHGRRSRWLLFWISLRHSGMLNIWLILWYIVIYGISFGRAVW